MYFFIAIPTSRVSIVFVQCVEIFAGVLVLFGRIIEVSL